MVSEQNIKLNVVEEFPYAVVAVSNDHKDVGVVTATLNYIPLNDFKEVFNFIGEELVKKKNIRKLVFDERNLTVFDQPSMEWYFTEWKEKMYDEGLKTYRKILPDNSVFRRTVEDESDDILKKHPKSRLNKMDIQYADSLIEAITH